MLSIIWANLLLFCFVANLLIGLHLLFRSRLGRRPLLNWIVAASAMLVAIVVAVDGLNLLNCFRYRNFQPWSYFPLMAATVAYCWLCLKSIHFAFDRSIKNFKQLIGVSLLLALASSNFWCWLRLSDFELFTDFALNACSPGQLVQERHIVGLTQAGSRLRLYRLDVSEESYQEYATTTLERVARMAEPLIVQEAPNQNYNCHGWVFTGGKFFLKGESVEQILRENGYRKIGIPQENDIVIYRSATGKILHTGLVRTQLSNGTILVESKWGADGRYLHRTENQPYSQNFEYYRTEQPSHVIAVQQVEGWGETERQEQSSSVDDEAIHLVKSAAP